VRREVIRREGRDEAGEKVEVDSMRDSMGGDGREGEGGRDGDRWMGEEEGGAWCGVTPTDTVCDGGGAKGLSEVASLRASSNGLRAVVVVSIAVLIGSARGSPTTK
jgi:hypothetical protein